MGLNLDIVRKCIITALEEDHVRDDITTRSLFNPVFKIRANIVASQRGIICGLSVIKEMFKILSKEVKFEIGLNDGDTIIEKQTVAKISGDCSILISSERVMLNFLSHLSGIATLTSKFINLTKKYDVKITDTRKTIPGLRHLEKYAVYIGGGINHRMDLSQMILVKDNHIKLFAKITSRENIFEEMVKIFRVQYPKKKIEIEIERLEQLEKALRVFPDIVMLDNMTPDDIKKAIKIKGKLSSYDSRIESVELEASGGINLDNIKKYAKTRVDRISIGIITNSAPALDFSMEVE